MTYPNGRVLQYLYDDEAADKLSRVRTLRWDGLDVCRYSYLGLGTFVITDYLEPEVKLNYAESHYSGFDRFGRIIDLHWQRYGEPPLESSSSSSSEDDPAGDSLVHLQYGYDRASSRTYRRDLVATAYGKAFDELYSYDGMHRLATFDRGILNPAGTVITSPTYQQGWNLDATGNWDGFTQTDTADSSNTLTQSRTANPVNEITAISHTVGTTWATPEYDANGNMTVIPQPKEMTKVFRATWDPWNRLVKLEEPDGNEGWQTLQENTYDGQTWRIVVKAYGGGTLENTRVAYFTNGWQEIENCSDAMPSIIEPDVRYIWGLRYLNDCILRDSGIANDPSERLYSIPDVQLSATALVASSGETACRILYLPFGVNTVFDRAFGGSEETGETWRHRFAGCEMDLASDLHHVRTRYINSELGVVLSRDSVGYHGSKWSLYQYVNSNPVTLLDPLGKEPLATSAIIESLSYEPDPVRRCWNREQWEECKRSGSLPPGQEPADFPFGIPFWPEFAPDPIWWGEEVSRGSDLWSQLPHASDVEGEGDTCKCITPYTSISRVRPRGSEGDYPVPGQPAIRCREGEQVLMRYPMICIGREDDPCRDPWSEECTAKHCYQYVLFVCKEIRGVTQWVNPRREGYKSNSVNTKCK